MRKVILFVICFLALHSCAQENTYTIKGKIGNYNDPAKIYLQYVADGKVVTQSETFKNGEFSFAGKVVSPTDARLVIIADGSPISDQRRYDDYLPLIIENAKINISSSDAIQNASVKGSPLNDDFKKLQTQLSEANNKIGELMQEYQSSSIDLQQDENYILSIQEKYEELEKKMKDVYKIFIQNNPNSYVSFIALKEYAGANPDFNEIEPLFNSLNAKITKSEEGVKYSKQIASQKKLNIGSVAPDFTQNDPDGVPIHLSDFRGKYLLIDFWASWCGPCRKENPNVVNVYNQYKNKNFEILGVSLDNPNAKQSWLNAIQKDGLSWTQVSDLKGWQNEVAVQYQVLSIPQNYLLDTNGVIIAKNLRGGALGAKLAELFKE